MFYKYLVTKLNGKKVLYLYLNQDYEVADELYHEKRNHKLIEHAQNYLDNLGVSYKGTDVYLVADNIIVGRIQMNRFFGKPKYLEYVQFGKNDQKVEVLDPNQVPVLKFIDVQRSSGVIDRLKFYEYLFGIVAREMPYIKNAECLKAQAVLARTYLLKTLKEKKKIREMNQYQLFLDNDYLSKLWGKNFYNYRAQILDALAATDKEVLTFDGDFIECYTHYQNAGKTEDSRNVLKLSYPYLISVDSMEGNREDLLKYRKVSNYQLSKILGIDLNANTRVRILDTTSGNNVRYIQFGNKVFDGLMIARTLGLVSNNFTVQVHDDYTTFLTKGCGYGLGLSKCGALAMAESGYTYKQILSHYYPNTKLEKVNENIL